MDPEAGTVAQMRELQRKFAINDLFEQDKFCYQGIMVYKKIQKSPKGQSIAFYTENGVNHGPARIIDEKGIPICEAVYSKGRLAEYFYMKTQNRTYCLIFKDGKPWEGNLFLPGHNNTGELEFKRGILLGFYEYENGYNRKILIDFSQDEFRNNGKIVVDQENVELLTYLNEVLEQIGYRFGD